jgi:beta-glucanase (GH16 family)
VAVSRRVYALVLLAFASIGVGTAGADTHSTRQRCVVPSVRRDELTAAEKRLRNAHCAVGRILGPRDGLVSVQRPKPGENERVLTKVALILVSEPTKATNVTTPTGTTRSATNTATTQSAAPEPVGISGDWHLVLDSEFNGRALNTSIWRTGWFGSGVTAPASRITSQACYSPSNVTFPGDGTMHLNVTAEPSTCGGATEPYTGALVTTNPDDGRASGGFQYTYGVLEARVYIPADGALIADWPAVWADGQSWPTDGEDDLLEGLGGSACSSLHGPLGLTNACEHLTPGWHTFASDWEPGSVTYYYDGLAVFRFATDITSAPMFIVLDNSVRSIQGANITEADSMQVQYVRVWQHQSRRG